MSVRIRMILARPVALLCLGLAMASCISSEPRALVPTITLSPETVSLSSGEPVGAGLNFGMSTSLNESDSLSNIAILPGVRVRSVNSNGAAELAGIQAGDVILEIDGREINHPDLLEALAQQTGSATSLLMQVRRNTTVFETTLNARMISDVRAVPVELYRADPIATRAGFSTEVFDTAGAAPVSGARIVRLFALSPFSAADLRVGDTILAINGQPVHSAQDFVTRVNTEYELGDTVRISIARDTGMQMQTLEKSIDLWSPGRRISRIALGPLLQYETSLSPQQTRLSILDLWLFSVFTYQHLEGEKEYSFLGLFRVASGYGELVEETQP